MEKAKTAEEIIFLKVMECPNIIRYCYSDYEKNGVHIYMEYAECGTLADLIT